MALQLQERAHPSSSLAWLTMQSASAMLPEMPSSLEMLSSAMLQKMLSLEMPSLEMLSSPSSPSMPSSETLSSRPFCLPRPMIHQPPAVIVAAYDYSMHAARSFVPTAVGECIRTYV